MLIGILQCDEVRKSMREQFDDYPDMFYQLLGRQDAQLEFKTYRVIDELFPQNPADCDAYLITGSRAGVYEDHPWIGPATALVRQLLDAHKPVVGICFGHQLLAQALGGRVEKSAKGWGVGLHRWDIRNTPWWMGDTGPSFSMLVSHQDQVLELPPGGQRIAGSDFCSIASFQVGEHALGFQGHPEFNRKFSRVLLELRRQTIGENLYFEGLASLGSAPDTSTVARWILTFMRGQ
jgi:GMP synthase-like glutamine amidotransferase